VASFSAGNGTVGTTPQQLSIACDVLKHVVVRASSGNNSTITVGPTSATGFILAAGEQTPPIYVNDISKILVVGGMADQNYSRIST
jgi:hypothetical protein